ncbi:MAG TPA: tetratricopeptide repeat protein [Desulfobacteraceae bacterium]|nr:tetratricopeptide repeat protein [Desulfobacteraceae bacterium]
MKTKTELRYHLIAVLAIFVLGIIIYSNTFKTPFVFDDADSITGNRYIRLTSLDPESLIDAGFKSPASKRPVANISFALNYYFGRYNVTGYHVVNIIIHLLNGILVYFLALTIFGQVFHSRATPPTLNSSLLTDNSSNSSLLILICSLFSALIFTAHPIQTQSVTYIVQRMNSMAAMFYLLSLLLYIKGRMALTNTKKLILLVACLVSWIMALGTKPTAVTLPFIIFLYEWYFVRDLDYAWFRRQIPYLVGIVIFVFILGYIYFNGNPFERVISGYKYREFSLGERLLTQPRVVLFYISLILLPLPGRLNLLHSFYISHSLTDPITTLPAITIIAGIIGLGLYLARKNRLVSFCIMWFFINLFLESSFVQLELVFEHRLYLPMFGFALIVPYLLFRFMSFRRSAAFSVLICIVLFFSICTYARNNTWRDKTTLWTDVISKNPYTNRGHNGLGLALLDKKRFEEAVEHFSKALEIKPRDSMTYNNLGNALLAMGDVDSAINRYRRAIDLKPEYSEAHNNLGLALGRKGDYSSAIRHYLEALRIRKDNEIVNNNLGVVLAETGFMNEAVERYETALRINPNYAEAHNNLGTLLARAGQIERAVKHFQEALSSRPDYSDAHNNMGNAFALKGKIDEAIYHYSEALRINPGADAHKNLAGILARKGDLEKAVRHYQEAIRMRPDYAEAHNDLGVAYARQGRFREAGECFSEALRIRPDYVDASRNLKMVVKEE